MIDPAELMNQSITEVRALVGEYSFGLKNLPGVNVRVKVWDTDVSENGERYTYTISHNVRTPKQGTPYFPSVTSGDTEQSAVERAIRDMLAFWPSGTEHGEPSEDWLVKNEDF